MPFGSLLIRYAIFATTKPRPKSATPVRSQARYVRSFASSSLSDIPRARRPASDREAEHSRRVLAHDGAHFVVGDAVELVGVARLRLGPRALGVWIVVAPHQRVEPAGVTVVDGDWVVYERGCALPPDELTREHRQLRPRV